MMCPRCGEGQTTTSARYCRDCRYDMELRHLFGVPLGWYKTQVEKQHGLCAGCKKPPEQGKRLEVDHDHVTGNVRGLLCWRCNRAVGFVNDSIETLQRLARYLVIPTMERDLETLKQMYEAELASGE